MLLALLPTALAVALSDPGQRALLALLPAIRWAWGALAALEIWLWRDGFVLWGMGIVGAAFLFLNLRAIVLTEGLAASPHPTKQDVQAAVHLMQGLDRLAHYWLLGGLLLLGLTLVAGVYKASLHITPDWGMTGWALLAAVGGLSALGSSLALRLLPQAVYCPFNEASIGSRRNASRACEREAAAFNDDYLSLGSCHAFFLYALAQRAGHLELLEPFSAPRAGAIAEPSEA